MDGHADFGAFVAFAPHTRAVAGPLAGQRVAVKDNIAVADMPYSAGLPRFAGRRAERDAACVAQLRRAGAWVVGVTRTDAGGLGVVTPEVTNPRDPSAIAGGSSGGSAAAVAAGLADFALGTDTAGSVRIPAACCGLLAFKPTHGRIASDGVWPLASELEDVGVIAARPETLAAAAGVLLDEGEAVAQRLPVIGVDRERLAGCHEAVRASFERSLARLSAAGCAVREVSLPARDAVCAAHSRIVLAEALRLYARPLAENDEAGLGATAWKSLRAATGIAPGLVEDARTLRRGVVSSWPSLLGSVDLVALPTLPVPVPPRGVKRIFLGGEPLPVATALTAETCLANFAGAPAVALPAANEASVQLVARAGDDAALLAHAARIAGILGKAA